MELNDLEDLLQRNIEWATSLKDKDSQFFVNTSKQQKPKYCWIGCSDSRVSPSQILDLPPGNIFVHRNIANQVNVNDTNCLSVIEYAIYFLEVKHIIVCGHTGCGGIESSFKKQSSKFINLWIDNILQLSIDHKRNLDTLNCGAERFDRLSELNVLNQIVNLGDLNLVKDAWTKNIDLSLHGWIYSLSDGLLHDLTGKVSSLNDLTIIRSLCAPQISGE